MTLREQHMSKDGPTYSHSKTPLPRAIDLVAGLDSGELSAVSLIQSTYDRIAQENPRINAICTLVPPEQSLEAAKRVDDARNQGQKLPNLAGLPLAVKDLADTQGILTTQGSPIHAQQIPDVDSLFVTRLKAAGGIVIGKTNTPEFGAGSHTFNPLFGVTRNPYDTLKTAGGSSGGAAAALASGMVALADGSDMGGSLRNPAAFCNVVGLRPSMGRVPTIPKAKETFSRMAVEGPMARTVEDCAMMLRAMAGRDSRDPRSLDLASLSAAPTLIDTPENLRLGWAPHPAGLPIEPTVSSVLSGAVADMQHLYPAIEEIDLAELRGAMGVFTVLRAAAFAVGLGDLYQSDSDKMKATVIDNIRLGLALTGEMLTQAETQRTHLYHALMALFDRYDYLLLPVTQVMPFPVEVECPGLINQEAMKSSIDWMSSCCILSPFDVPCLSIPAGFDSDGLPVGLQIVGKPGDDWGLLRLAYAFQQHTDHWRKAPPTAAEVPHETP